VTNCRGIEFVKPREEFQVHRARGSSMSRTPRHEHPGAWHHVMNRGIAKRTLFESREDVRFFLSRLAQAVRRAEIEVHAYCIMTTHFHLLVRSLRGLLSESMRRVQNDYVRHFNRRRRRDGPLVRGRFGSRLVDSLAYRRSLVRYIDSNPVRAGISPRAEAFEYGSAWHYSRASGPPWLERSWVEASVCADSGSGRYDPAAYGRSFGAQRSDAERRWIERRILIPCESADPVDDLLSRADGRTLAWMRRKAGLADGSRPGMPVADEEEVEALLERERELSGDWRLLRKRTEWDGWHLARVALLRDACGTTYREIAARTGRSRQDACLSYSRHVELLNADSGYATRLADLAERAVANTTGLGAVCRSGAVPHKTADAQG
jgi:REP element-mobilizing transposase RayT